MMQDSLRFLTLKDLDYIELKELGRFRQKTVKQRTRLKIQLTSYLDQVFPELQYFFKSGLHQRSVYTLLKEAPTPNAIASMHMAYVVKNSSTFKAYYEAKRAEGRTHYNALGHCAGKLVRVIFKMLTDEVEFANLCLTFHSWSPGAAGQAVIRGSCRIFILVSLKIIS